MRISGAFRHKGLTLVEVMIGVVVLSIATLGVMGALTFGIVSNDYAGTYSQANQMAREIVEGVRAEQLAFDTSHPAYLEIFDPSKKPVAAAPFDGSHPDLTLPDLTLKRLNEDTGSDEKLFGEEVERFERVVSVEDVPGDDQLAKIVATVYWEMKGVEKRVTVIAFARNSEGFSGGSGSGGSGSGSGGSGSGGGGNGGGSGGNGGGGSSGGGGSNGGGGGNGNGNGNGGGNGNGNGNGNGGNGNNR